MKLHLETLPIFLATLVLVVSASAQEETDDKKEAALSGFNWLEQFSGNWSSISKSADGLKVAAKGTMSSRKLGTNWIVNEFNATMKVPSGSVRFTAIQTLGFDKKSKRFRGHWIDSMSDFKWTYDGVLDESGKKILLYAEGPDWTNPDKMRKYRDTYEFESKDVIAATSQVQSEDGEWETFMRGEMTRTDGKSDK